MDRVVKEESVGTPGGPSTLKVYPSVTVEGRFGKESVVTTGYRGVTRNL